MEGAKERIRHTSKFELVEQQAQKTQVHEFTSQREERGKGLPS